MKYETIPVIDLFAGPGGLGEGFSTLGLSEGRSRFKLSLSIEKDRRAHETLELRSFFRQFSNGAVPNEYYAHIRGEITRQVLFNKYPKEAKYASQEAWHAELGKTPAEPVDLRISSSLQENKTWVLIGGPPCQAYSIIGRSRLGGIDPADDRVHLYREYLRIISVHAPPVFVMENVPGLLTSRVAGSLIFHQILEDLEEPAKAVRKLKGNRRNKLSKVGYRIYSFVKEPQFDLFGKSHYRPRDFIIKSENYGIPQARHRVILLGLREDLSIDSPKQLKKQKSRVAASKVLFPLPRLRSGLSREPDSKKLWRQKIRCALNEGWFSEICIREEPQLLKVIQKNLTDLRIPQKDRGAEFVPYRRMINYMPEWFNDQKLGGVCNHSTRAHIGSDIHRYLFAACFAKVKERSPQLKDFPRQLLPAHRNVHKAMKNDNFSDRFRVQISNLPATTITSHISKDGHYYIHPDPGQCRSLTVREAARLQTFPDNYFFCGARTPQYVQVGNAVPPLLARQIADIVLDVLRQANLTD